MKNPFSSSVARLTNFRKSSNMRAQSIGALGFILTGGAFDAILVASGDQLQAATVCVSQTSTNPTPPYATWDTAANTIQEAVDAASDGDTVVVAAGEYRLTNQISIAKAIVVQSADGPGQTIVNGDQRTRGIWISNSLAVVAGFTIHRGADNTPKVACGVAMFGGVLSNCIVRYTTSPHSGGRLVYCANGGLITDCQIGPSLDGAWPDKGAGVYLTHSQLRNSVISGILGQYYIGSALQGAGVYAISSTISGCTITNNWAWLAGGGAYLDGCEVDRCTIVGNNAGHGLASEGRGGGVFATNSTIRNSLVARNFALNGSGHTGDGTVPGFGGGVYLRGGSLLNCTVVSNGAAQGGGAYVESGVVRNSIIYFNSASSNANWYNEGGSFDHTCTTPDPGGVGNIFNDPQFIDRTNCNYRLLPTSPCVDAGVNESWTFGAHDLDGNSRVVHDRVDLGAYEAPWPQFAPCQVANGMFRSTIRGLSGQGTIVIERSTDLIRWQPVETNTINGGGFELVIPISRNDPAQFWRALIGD
jgi:hypothetical protein